MNNCSQPSKTVFHRLGPEMDDGHSCQHLKPLSLYARMTSFVSDSGRCIDYGNSTNLLYNLKIEVLNPSAVCKRRLEDSFLDVTYETPPKRHCGRNSASPDLACVLDASDCPSVVGGIEGNDRAVDNTSVLPRSSRVLSGQVERSGGGANSKGPSSPVRAHARPDTLAIAEKAFMDLGPAFDFDINGTSYLRPIGSDEEPSDLVKRSHGFYTGENSLQLGGTQSYALDGGRLVHRDSAGGGGRGELESYGSDEGYDSSIAAPGTTAQESEVRCWLRPTMSTPVARATKSNMALRSKASEEVEGELSCLRSPIKEEPVRTPALSLSCSVEGRSGMDGGLEGLPMIALSDGEGGGGRSSCEGGIHAPAITQGASFCHGAQRGAREAVNSKTAEVGEVEVEEVEEAISPEFQVTFQDEESGPDSTFEISLPIQVQVRSKVVVPVTKGTAATTQPERKTTELGIHRSIHRPLHGPARSDREDDWERAMRSYVDSVIRHMNDPSGVRDGVMTELQQLMNTVARQGAGPEGRPYQHPSDLTRRNYRARRGKGMPLRSLQEWKNSSQPLLRRFSKVPRSFERSPVL